MKVNEALVLHDQCPEKNSAGESSLFSATLYHVVLHDQLNKMLDRDLSGV